MDSFERQILINKREQFRVKIRNEKLDCFFNKNRLKLMNQDMSSEPSSDASFHNIRRKLGKLAMTTDFEVYVSEIVNSTLIYSILGSIPDTDCLNILCNLCTTENQQSFELLQKIGIAHQILAICKQISVDKELEKINQCIWTLSNYMCKINQDFLIIDLKQLVENNLVEYVVELRKYLRMKSKIYKLDEELIFKCTELFFNIFYHLDKLNIEFRYFFNIKQLTDIYVESLIDLRICSYDLKCNFSILVLQFCLKQAPSIFQETTEVDILNILKQLNSQVPRQLYYTLSLLNQITTEGDELKIQRLLFYTMIEDIQKHIHNPNKLVRIQCFQILNNIAISNATSIKERIASVGFYHELSRLYCLCTDKQVEIEIIYLLYSLTESCYEFLGKEAIQDSGIVTYIQNKLLDSENNLENFTKITQLISFIKINNIALLDDKTYYKLESLRQFQDPEIDYYCELILGQ